MLKLPRLVPLVAMACLLALPSVASADSFSVFVGYADNLRPSGFFPTPWLGAGTVVSQTPPGESLDTGAIRIDNTGATSITITNFSVAFNGSSASVAIWSPLTISSGQTGIFAQTASYNLSSSDFGIFGGFPPAALAPTVPGNNEIGGCSSTAAILATDPVDAAKCAANAPMVSFMENGNLVTMTDTGQILNTGGYDFINGSSDGNESINWNTIGSGASRSNRGFLTLSVSPRQRFDGPWRIRKKFLR